MRRMKSAIACPRQKTYEYSVLPRPKRAAERRENRAESPPRLSPRFLDLPKGVFPLALYGGETPLVYASNKKLYRVSGLYTAYVTDALSSVPVCLSFPLGGEAVELFSDGERTVAVRGAAMEETLFPGADAFAACGDRLFAAKGSRIFYSDALPIMPVRAAGSLALPADCGSVRALAVLGGDVYCFCDRAAFRFAARGGEAEFSLAPVDRLNAACDVAPVSFGGKLYYRSGGGLWSFDGSRAVREEPRFDCVALVAGKHYLLAERKTGERGVLAVGAAGETHFFAGEYAASPAFGGCLLHEHACRCEVPSPRALYEEGASAWKSGISTLGRRGVKRLETVEAESARAFALEIVSDSCRMRFSLPAGRSTVNPGMIGREFSFSADVGTSSLASLTAVYRMNE